MKTIAIVTLLLLFTGQNLAPFSKKKLIVWDVGQGLWVTVLHQGSCYHFDTGGEYFDRSKLNFYCRKSKNYLYYSHNDLDHISFSKALPFRQYCAVSNFMKKKGIFPIKKSCPQPRQSPAETVYSPYKKKFNQNSNELSKVYTWDKKVLLPGDSLKKNEIYWSKKVKNMNIEILILGHHGSATSTSNQLLRNLAHLKLAIASARKSRFGHPHPDVYLRLSQRGIPLISTEKWGNITIELE